MWPFKNKYEKLTRQDVNDAICKLDAESKKNDQELLDFEKQILEITVLAKKEKTKEIKLNYIKKISYMKRRRIAIAKRNSYILYNIELMERLKQAIDDNQMFQITNGMSLNKLLADQKGLRNFLMKSLNMKQKSEQTLINSNEIFDTIDDLADSADDIYGKNESDDELLAAFEKEEGMFDDFGDSQEDKDDKTIAQEGDIVNEFTNE